MKIGYFLSSEQCTPSQLISQARQARDSGFDALSISDHYHPWNEAQGNSPFVWSLIGAISQIAPLLPMSTMVTCPLIRINPVILAQAAATTSLLCDAGFVFGVGTGENLNEHVLGDRWPDAKERLERLAEAIALMRLLWTGENVTFEGHYYRAVNARLYTLPRTRPPVYVSGLGPLSTQLAVDVGDGFVTPDANMLQEYRLRGGCGTTQTAMKVCFDHDEDRAVETMRRLWSVKLNPGQLNRELAQPRHVESAASLVTSEMVAEHFTCGGDPQLHVEAIQRRFEEGFDEVYVQQVGPAVNGFFDLYRREVLPSLRQAASSGETAPGMKGAHPPAPAGRLDSHENGRWTPWGNTQG